jgi:hypothetical protein
MGKALAKLLFSKLSSSQILDPRIIAVKVTFLQFKLFKVKPLLSKSLSR